MNEDARNTAAPKNSYCKLDLAILRFLAGLLEILFRFNPVNEVLRAELKVVISEIKRREQ